ncbi:hypothetical protein [Brucella haematophila]|uniref:Uncharacterized protein n=1 Tax=Brucella haematophila TaxID=419474 RepID=A0ABX1DN32_9HYPH|nr:hypothetical protein [Brucella haematophila]NKC04365.1 hypothetical protein [Brucella haematophila]TMU91774.1 hypothetical protein FGI60_21300 [Brucella haematophila]
MVATADQQVGLFVRFDGSADQHREARIICLARYGVRPAIGLPATPDTPAPAQVRRSLARKHPAGSIRLGLEGQDEKTAAKATGAASPIPARRRTAAIAVFPQFPETGAPFASSIGMV